MALALTNSQYDKLMQEYQALRFDVKNTARLHKKEAYKKIPELKELDNELLDATKNSDINSLNLIIQDISKRKSELLIKHGYPSDYLIENYHCKKCNDTGLIGNSRCECFKNMVIKLYYGNKMWLNIFRNENFDKFDLSYYENSDIENSLASAKDALAKSKDFVNAVLNGDSHTNLIISGNTGVGKTFLCNCIAKELIEQEKFVVYLPAPSLFELFERISFSYKRKDEEYSPEAKNTHYSNIFDCELLIIDDLGTEYTNNFTNSRLLDLVNKRLLANLSTLISTNLSLQGVKEQYSERLLSRIVGNYKLICLYGDDIRVKKRSIVAHA